MVNYIYRGCVKIFATSPSFVEKLEERESVYERVGVGKGDISAKGGSKVLYWPQYAEEFYRPIDVKEAEKYIDSETIPIDKKFKIVFTGKLRGFNAFFTSLVRVAFVRNWKKK